MNIKSAVSLAVAAGLAVATGLFAQNAPTNPYHKVEPRAGASGSTNMTDRCRAMMERHRELQVEIRTMDAQLDRLVSDMNSAPPERKADATAAVVNKLVEQRRALLDKLLTWHGRMLQHMSEHMGKGQCPMMQESSIESSRERRE